MVIATSALWGVLVSVLATMALGMFWYSPIGFGNIWVKLNGWSTKELEAMRKKGMTQSMILAVISNIVMALVFIKFLTPFSTIAQAHFIALFIWLGFVATTQISTFLWEHKPFSLFLINTGYSLVNLLLVSTVLFYLH